MLARCAFASALAATAGLSVIPFTAAAQPGLPAGISGYDQPGEGSVTSYVLVGLRSAVIVDCQRALPEARQLLALVRSLDKPVKRCSSPTSTLTTLAAWT